MKNDIGCLSIANIESLKLENIEIYNNYVGNIISKLNKLKFFIKLYL